MSAALPSLLTAAGVPLRDGVGARPVLLPADEAALARALAAFERAGLPPHLDGLDAGDAPAVSLEGFGRVIGVKADDGIAVVEPGVRWSTFEAALAATAFECPVVPASDPSASVLAVALERVRVRAFHPFGDRAEWVRDVRLVTTAGTVVRAPYAPRRATGPELRLAALAFGAAWGVPTSLTVRVVPRCPRETRTVELPAAEALAALERLGALGDEASFLAEVRLAGKSARLQLTWRQALREPPEALWSTAVPAEPEGVEPGPAVTLRVPWGEATDAWLAGLAGGRRKAGRPKAVRLWGPDRQGVRVELEGPATLAEAAAAGLLPPGLSERLEHLAGLRARLSERGAA